MQILKWIHARSVTISSWNCVSGADHLIDRGPSMAPDTTAMFFFLFRVGIECQGIQRSTTSTDCNIAWGGTVSLRSSASLVFVCHSLDYDLRRRSQFAITPTTSTASLGG